MMAERTAAVKSTPVKTAAVKSTVLESAATESAATEAAPKSKTESDRRIIITIISAVGRIIIIRVNVSRLRIGNHVNGRSRRFNGNTLDIGLRGRRIGRWCLGIVGHGSRRRSLRGNGRAVFAFLQHGGNHAIGNALILEIKNLRCPQAVLRSEE